MELGTFTPRTNDDMIMGDKLSASDAIDRPFVILVREHRTGIVTKYKPDGGDGVIVDVADVSTNEIWIDVLWMNGAIVDNLANYVGQPVAVKLVWKAPTKGGNSYVAVVPLEGTELALAQQWATANSSRFETERAERVKQQANGTPDTTTAPTAPAATSTPTVTPQHAPAPTATAAPSTDDIAAAAAQNPQIAALLAQLAAQNKAS